MMAADDSRERLDTHDVVISYEASDIDFVKQLSGDLRNSGMSVWYVDPTNAESQNHVIGKAVTACKVFLLILSETSAEDSNCKDQLALAYISNSSIFPVGRQRIHDLSPKTDCGMKLMLAKINWVFFVKDEDYATNFPSFVTSIRQELELKSEHGTSNGFNLASDDESELSTFQILKMYSHCDTSLLDSMQAQTVCDFWEKYFQGKSEVTWIVFRESFLSEYGTIIKDDYSEDKEKFFVNLIYKDIFYLNKIIKRAVYDKFCSENKRNDPDIFYNRLQEYGRGIYAMREVFDMDSTLRLTAVQNLGKFSTPAVTSALLEMLQDNDANIRAVSAIALARTGKKQNRVIQALVKCLDDEDRLVRESVCLSLGYLQASTAVKALIHTWRNDAISTVREAAQKSLKMIPCSEAQECIHMTTVLTQEMAALRKPNK